MRLIALSLLFCLACTTSVESLNCFGHHCDSHKSKCVVHGEHGLTGRCEEAHMCHDRSTCTTSNVHAHGPHHECCCETQDCIDNLGAAKASAPHLTCFGHTCDSFREGCLVGKEQDRLTGWCEPIEGCRHHSTCPAPHHGREHECCCTDQHCVDNLSGTSSINIAPPVVALGTLNCFGEYCDGHRSACIVNGEHGMTGRCEDLHICNDHSTCTATNVHAHGPHHECCCQDQSCIDVLKAAQSLAPQLTCFGHTCDSFSEGCVVAKEHDRLTGWCEHIEGCRHHSTCPAPHHGREHECCCTDQHCVDNLSGSSSQQSSSGSLHCGHVTCLAHSTHPYCKLHSVDGRLEGECIEHKTCGDHHHRLCHTSHDLHHGECCCQDSACIATVTGVATAAPATHAPVHHNTTVQHQTTQPPATGMNTDFPATQPPSNPATTVKQQTQPPKPDMSTALPATQAPQGPNSTDHPQTQAPQGPDTTVQQQTNAPTTGKPTMAPTTNGPSMLLTTAPAQPVTACPPFDLTCPAGCATYDVKLCPICDMTSPDCVVQGGSSSTMAPVVTSTPMATTPKVCQDTDPDNCVAMHDALCTSNDANIHHLAVVTCAKSCGFCDEYLGIDTTTTQAPPVPTTTKPIVTTIQKVCADVDPDNCARMQGALCPTTDPNLHHMAVSTCAKTCNLCAEFMLI